MNTIIIGNNQNFFLTLKKLYNEFEASKPNKVDVSCPFCESNSFNNTFSFESSDYRECEECSSLYISPRITKDELQKYFECLIPFS